MRRIKALEKLLKPLVEDGRMGPVHVTVFLALVICGRRVEGSERCVIRREDVMRVAKIKGRTTFYRVMKDLVKSGFIVYWPGDGTRESEVWVGSWGKRVKA